KHADLHNVPPCHMAGHATPGDRDLVILKGQRQRLIPPPSAGNKPNTGLSASYCSIAVSYWFSCSLRNYTEFSGLNTYVERRLTGDSFEKASNLTRISVGSCAGKRRSGAGVSRSVRIRNSYGTLGHHECERKLPFPQRRAISELQWNR